MRARTLRTALLLGLWAGSTFAQGDCTAQEESLRSLPFDTLSALARDFHATGERFHAAIGAAWTNHEGRLSISRDFLNNNTRWDYWARMCFSSLNSSFDKLEKKDSLAALAEEWVRRYPGDPFALSGAAMIHLYWFNNAEKALALVAQAKECEARYQASLFFTPRRWSFDRLGLWHRLRGTEAWALALRGRSAEAKSLALGSIAADPSGADDALVRGIYHLALAEAYRHERAADSAARHYALAAHHGDGRDRLGSRARERFASLMKEQGRPVPASEEETIARMQEAMQWQGLRFEWWDEPSGIGVRKESRVAWGDLDDDGRPDLMLDGTFLYRNKGNGTFEALATPYPEAPGIGGLWGDYDGDGRQDILRLRSGRNMLLRNKGDGTFEDVSAATGLICDEVSTEGACWTDLNGDGWIDLYLANYEAWDGAKNTSTPYRDEVWINHGGTFTRDTSLFPPIQARAARGATACDYNRDGFPDVYVSNYRLAPNTLWTSQKTATGQLRFVDQGVATSLAGKNTEGYFGHTTGSSWADFNNDGHWDLIAPNMAHPRYIDFSNMTMLYYGAADGTFREGRGRARLYFEETQTDACAADFDNDGRQDLLITSTYEDRPSHLYRQMPDGTFEEQTIASGCRMTDNCGAAAADIDGDGDADLFVGSGHVYRTRTYFRKNLLNDDKKKQKSWVAIRVRAERNTWGVGATVTIRYGDKQQMTTIDGGHGTASQHAPWAHFGLGDYSGDVEITVVMPGGKKTVQTVKKLNRTIEVKVR